MSWSLRTTKTREEPGAASPPPARSDPVRAQPPARGRPAAGRSSAGTRDPPPRSNRVSHTSTSAGPHSKHSCLEAGSAPGTTCGRGRRGRQGEPGTSGTPLPVPLRPLTTSGGSTSTSSMLPTALASRSPGGPGAAARAAACRRPRGLGRGFSSAPPLGARHPAGSRLPPAPTEAPPRGSGQAPGALAPDAPKAPQGPGGAGAG